MNKFTQQLAEKEKRKLKALRENKQSIWSVLGMFGMVGWSVVVPALLGAALGKWLDKKFAETFSWTLTLLIAGLFAGCAIAWNWITKENKEAHQNKNETDE